MGVQRGPNFKPVPLNIVGSSIFGRYPKISIEKTYNMFMSDTFMVPYSGYEIAINASKFNNGKVGRGCFTSTKFNRLVIVIDENVYLVNINYNTISHNPSVTNVLFIGKLQTRTGVVYITENNKPQIAISDGNSIYIYDPTGPSQMPPVAPFSIAQSFTPGSPDVTGPLTFVPGYITFHDTYFLCAAKQDNFYVPAATNVWHISKSNNGLIWPNTSNTIGFLQSKPDKIQAVVRFPSKGNMIFVMGSITTEAWNDTGAQLFPYQRQNQFNIDYGCLSPASVAFMDEIVVWLASNEKSGPIIMYSSGGMPKKITTDGIDYLFSQLKNPADSQGFLYRQDGHLFYHINFYTDNFSLFYDFNNDKFYNASDQDLNYFIAAEVAFFNNQYYFVSKNTGNLYALDTIFTTYQDTDSLGNISLHEIPRIRTCKNMRQQSQDYFIANDTGFTIETGETDYYQQSLGQSTLITQDGNVLIAQDVGSPQFYTFQNGNYIQTQNGTYLEDQVSDSNPNDVISFLTQQNLLEYVTPRVDLAISTDGGASFGNYVPYVLNPIGQRKNKLIWWHGGIVNDLVHQFRFWGFGRFVVTDGETNIR